MVTRGEYGDGIDNKVQAVLVGVVVVLVVVVIVVRVGGRFGEFSSLTNSSTKSSVSEEDVRTGHRCPFFGWPHLLQL